MNLVLSNKEVAQHGIYLPFSALLLFVILIMAGLAVDSGRLYLIRQQAQHAVDAATISGVYLLPYTDPATVEQIVSRHIQTNLSSNGLLTQVESLDIQATSFDVRSEVRLRSPLYLLRIIPGLIDVALSATSHAKRPTLLIALALDRSSTMLEEDGASGVTKLDNLKLAASELIESLSPANGDRVALIPFANNADIAHSFSDPLDQANLINTINGISANGATCISCALYLALQEFEAFAPSTPAGTLKVLVLISDGRPSRYAPAEWNLPTCGWDRSEVIGVAPQVLFKANFSQGRFLESAAVGNMLRAQGVTIYTIAAGQSTTYGTPVCGPANINPVPPETPASADIFGCFFCETPSPFNISAAPYEINQFGMSNPESQQYQWCGGSINKTFLAELANDPAVYDAAYSLPMADGFRAPANFICSIPAQDLLDVSSDCWCQARIGSEFPQGLYLETAQSAQLGTLFEQVKQELTAKVRIVE